LICWKDEAEAFNIARRKSGSMIINIIKLFLFIVE